MRKQSFIHFILVILPGFVLAQISTTCVPSVSITTSAVNNSICIGQSATYTISGGVTYIFISTPSTSPSFTGATGAVSPTTHTSYQVIGTNQFGCTSSAQQIIFVNQLPQISISASPTMVCAGFPSTLSAFSAPGNTAYAYNWAHGGSSSESVVSPTVTNVYTVTGTNTITSCQNSQTIAVAVFNPTFTVTPDTGVCKGNSITLMASGAKTFTWTGGPSFGNGTTYVVSPTVVTIYTVGATSWPANSSVKCIWTNTITVEIYPQPTVTAVPSITSSVCPGSPVLLYAMGAESYYWPALNQSGSPAYVLASNYDTKYKVIGTDSFGCKDTSELLVRVDRHCYRGLEELHNNSLLVSPNPASAFFVLEAPSPLIIIIQNITGQIVKEIELVASGPQVIDAREMSDGIYFLIGHCSGRVFTRRVIIHK